LAGISIPIPVLIPLMRPVFDDESGHHVLPEIDIGSLFQFEAPFLGEPHPVALGAGAPHCGAFGAVEHPELDHGFVGDNAGVSTHGIDLTNKLSFGDTTHGGVAGHLCNGSHVHGHEQNAASHIGGGGGGFASGMPGTHHNHIIFWKHLISVFLVYPHYQILLDSGVVVPRLILELFHVEQLN
jgi:hypothetical protein